MVSIVKVELRYRAEDGTYYIQMYSEEYLELAEQAEALINRVYDGNDMGEERMDADLLEYLQTRLKEEQRFVRLPPQDVPAGVQARPLHERPGNGNGKVLRVPELLYQRFLRILRENSGS